MQVATSSAWTAPLIPPQSSFGWCRGAQETLRLRAGWVWASLWLWERGAALIPLFQPSPGLEALVGWQGRSLPYLAVVCPGMCVMALLGWAGGVTAMSGLAALVAVLGVLSPGPWVLRASWAPLGKPRGLPGVPILPAQPLAVLPRCL